MPSTEKALSPGGLAISLDGCSPSFANTTTSSISINEFDNVLRSFCESLWNPPCLCCSGVKLIRRSILNGTYRAKS